MANAGPTSAKVKVLFFETGRQGGSVFRLLSIIQRIDRTRFEVGLVSYYRDRAAALLLRESRLFCRHRLHVPWYPQPDAFKPLFGLPVPTPFGIYLFLVSMIVLWRHRPDVVYMNTGIGGLEPAIIAARLLGTKVVCHLRISRELNAYEVRLARRVQRLVTCSEWGAMFYETQVRGDGIATCIYDGIDLAEFDARAREPLQGPLAEGPIYVCQVGSLIPRKRPQLALAAFEIARQMVPDLKLILVGDGPLRTELEDLVRERGLQGEVLLTGHRGDVPALLRRSHIGLLLSEHEGLPNSILEYMASRLPVVVVRFPFIRELIQDGANGVVIEEASPQAIAQAIIAVACSPGRRERLGRAGREAVEAGVFHPEREARGIEALLAEVRHADSLVPSTRAARCRE